MTREKLPVCGRNPIPQHQIEMSSQFTPTLFARHTFDSGELIVSRCNERPAGFVAFFVASQQAT